MPSLQIDGATIAYSDTGSGEPVILAHCSGGSRRQWRALADRLAGHYRVLAPDLYGYGETDPWPDNRPFSVADDCAVINALIDEVGQPVHLVGHSYGGALCLDVALRRHGRIKSLALYEPVAFHLLRIHGDAAGWSEIGQVALRHIDLVDDGDLAACADAFMDYWIGSAAWQGMPAEARAAITATMPKIALEFRNSFDSAIRLDDYQRIDAPTLLLRGSDTTLAARRVSELLAGSLVDRAFVCIRGAGHMGPLTHADLVNDAIADHLDSHALPPARAATEREAV